MRPLRLPPPLPRSLRFPSLAESFAFPRASLATAARNAALTPGRWSSGVVPIRLSVEGSVRRFQLSRMPPCAFAPLSDPGPASVHLACVPLAGRLTSCTAVLSPRRVIGRTRTIVRFRDSITQLWHSLHTLHAPLAGMLCNVRFRVAASLSRVGVRTHWAFFIMFHFLSVVSSCSGCWRETPSDWPADCTVFVEDLLAHRDAFVAGCYA
jgi:hypothetical protein